MIDLDRVKTHIGKRAAFRFDRLQCKPNMSLDMMNNDIEHNDESREPGRDGYVRDLLRGILFVAIMAIPIIVMMILSIMGDSAPAFIVDGLSWPFP